MCLESQSERVRYQEQRECQLEASYLSYLFWTCNRVPVAVDALLP